MSHIFEHCDNLLLEGFQLRERKQWTATGCTKVLRAKHSERELLVFSGGSEFCLQVLLSHGFFSSQSDWGTVRVAISRETTAWSAVRTVNSWSGGGLSSHDKCNNQTVIRRRSGIRQRILKRVSGSAQVDANSHNPNCVARHHVEAPETLSKRRGSSTWFFLLKYFMCYTVQYKISGICSGSQVQKSERVPLVNNSINRMNVVRGNFAVWEWCWNLGPSWSICVNGMCALNAHQCGSSHSGDKESHTKHDVSTFSHNGARSSYFLNLSCARCACWLVLALHCRFPKSFIDHVLQERRLWHHRKWRV